MPVVGSAECPACSFTKKLLIAPVLEPGIVAKHRGEFRGIGAVMDSEIPGMQVIGYVVCSVKSLALHIAHLAVDSKMRRQGVGKRLVLVSPDGSVTDDGRYLVQRLVSS